MQEPSKTAPHYPELGFYGLAGHTDNPRDLLGEVMEAEQLGLGSVFLSERFNYKDAAVMDAANKPLKAGTHLVPTQFGAGRSAC